MLRRESADTRTKIMQVAFELFGRYGFEGTSVRQIAQKSGVNLAAVNYHFTSKELLYWEIMVMTYRDLEKEVQSYATSSKDVRDLAMKTFEHFRREKYALKNAMKMMLEESVELPESPELLAVINNPMGPPGGQFFAEFIQKETPYLLSREGLMWGVKATFGAVFHWATMCATEHCIEEGPGADPVMTSAQIAKDVELMVAAALDFLRANPARFRA
jgi:AcrR family transcriptional regulator